MFFEMVFKILIETLFVPLFVDTCHGGRRDEKTRRVLLLKERAMGWVSSPVPEEGCHQYDVIALDLLLLLL